MNPFLPNVLPPQSKEVELKLYLIFGKFYLSTTAIAFDLKEWLRNKTYWIRKFLFWFSSTSSTLNQKDTWINLI